MSGGLVGTRLEGGYRVVSVIGESHDGGTVYLAEDGSGTRFAVRCPRVATDYTREELEVALARFDREARDLAELGKASTDVEQLVAHGIVEVGRQKVPYAVFAWLEGEPLDRWAASHPGPRSIGEVIAILGPVFRALATAHRRGVLHLDVRPGNVWIAASGGRTTVKLTGFALASHLERGERPIHPTHAAPEHFKRTYGAFSPATDVYGLGLLLVELVAGVPALTGSDPGELYLCTSDLAKRPTLRARGAQVSDALEAVVARALAVDPRRRWPDAQELFDAVRSAVPELTPAPPSVRPPGEAGVVAPAASSPVLARAGSASGTVKAAPVRSKALRALWVVTGAVLLGGLGLAGARFLRNGGATVPTASVKVIPLPAPVDAASPAAADAATADDAAAADAGQPGEEVASVPAFPTDMLRVPAGAFTMGTDREGKGDGPAHQVTLSRAFYIDRTEVTTVAYAACIAAGACTPVGVHAGNIVETTYGCNTDKDRPHHPVNCVDRAQAESFCAFAGKRLPTEAEWEYAARGSDQRAYPWGNEAPTSCEQAVLPAMSGTCGERKGTAEVGAASAGKSAFGAFDMAGNVWEWVADAYDPYPSGEVTDPKVPLRAGVRGVLRGGSWDYSPTSAKTTFRLPFPPGNGNVSIGFRCARDAE